MKDRGETLPTRIGTGAAACAVALALGLAASAQPPVRGIDEAAAASYERALARLRDQDLRVATIAYRLAVANAELCPATGPVTGMVLHNALQYGPATRPYAVRFFGLGTGPAILTVAPQSPAERAGLRPGDQLIAVGGAAFAQPTGLGGRGRYDGVQRANDLLAAALAQGAAVLTVRRGQEERQVRLEPTMGCAYEVQLIPGDGLSGKADGVRIFITTGMVDYAPADDDLALVIGHELAHDVREHRKRPRMSTRAEEREADYVGLYLAARAGYGVKGASAFWRRFGSGSLADILPPLSHPSSGARARSLAAAAIEIEAKQARGEALVPDPRRLGPP